MIFSTYDPNDSGPRSRFSPGTASHFKGSSKSSSQQSSTTKDNSAVLQDQAINGTDGSIAGQGNVSTTSGNVNVNTLDGGAVSESLQFAEFLADRGFGFGTEALFTVGQANRDSLNFADGAMGRANSFALDSSNRAYDFSNNALNTTGLLIQDSQRDAYDFANNAAGFAGMIVGDTTRGALDLAAGADQRALSWLNNANESNRQLTDKVISGIIETAEPETSDIAKFSTGALVIAGLGAAYLFTRKKAS